MTGSASVTMMNVYHQPWAKQRGHILKLLFKRVLYNAKTIMQENVTKYITFFSLCEPTKLIENYQG